MPPPNRRSAGLRERVYRSYRRLETKEHRLLYLFLELTRRCNLACIHCGSDCVASESAHTLDLSGWMTVVDYIAARFRPAPAITLTGGEPLLLGWLPELGRHIASLGMRWGLVTNGLELDGKKMGELGDAHAESITLSLDGLERTHDYMRARPGAWKNAMRALAVLGASDIAVTDVVTCVRPATLHELDTLAEIILASGVRSWRLFRIFPKGRASEHPELFLGRDDYIALLEWIRRKRPVLAARGLGISLSCDGWLPYGMDRRVRDTPFFCRSGIQIASIMSDGAITGCPNNDPGFAQGNFFGDDFSAVWNNGFRMFRDRSWTESTSCASCDVKAGCIGGSMHAWSPGAATSAQCWMLDASPLPSSDPGL